MGMLDTLGRIPKILESNINAMLDKAEDPVKMMDQLLIDAKKDLADVKVSYAEAKAATKSAQKDVDDTKAKIERKLQAAKNAKAQGTANNDENAIADAKQLIAEKQELEATLADLEKTLETCKQTESTLEKGYNKLSEDIAQLERRRNAAKGKASAAAGQEKLNQASKKTDSRKALDAFSRYEENIDKRLETAKAMAEIDEAASSSSLEDKYAGAGNQASVDEEFDKL